jgi:hypothetical protein
MDVSKSVSMSLLNSEEIALQGTPGNEIPQVELGGRVLLETVASLTGLPQNLVHDELDQILKLSPGNPEGGDLTMQELRTAMLAYLETLGESFGDGSLESAESMSEVELSGILPGSDFS